MGVFFTYVSGCCWYEDCDDVPVIRTSSHSRFLVHLEYYVLSSFIGFDVLIIVLRFVGLALASKSHNQLHHSLLTIFNLPSHYSSSLMFMFILASHLHVSHLFEIHETRSKLNKRHVRWRAGSRPRCKDHKDILTFHSKEKFVNFSRYFFSINRLQNQISCFIKSLADSTTFIHDFNGFAGNVAPSDDAMGRGR